MTDPGPTRSGPGDSEAERTADPGPRATGPRNPESGGPAPMETGRRAPVAADRDREPARTPASWESRLDELLDGVPTDRILTGLGSLLVVVGAFLPWASMEILGQAPMARGIDEWGRYTLVLAVAVIPLLLFAWNRKTKAVTMVVGAIVTFLSLPLLIAVEIFHHAVPTGGDAEPIASAELGLYLTVLGGLIIFGAAGFSLLIQYLEAQERPHRRASEQY